MPQQEGFISFQDIRQAKPQAPQPREGFIAMPPASPTEGRVVGITDVAGPGFNLLVGAGKSVVDALVGAGQLANQVFGAGRAVDPATFKRAREAIAPTTPAQQAGFTGGQIAQFAIPLGGQAQAARLAAGAPRLVRGAARMVGEAAEFGGKTAAQGGDVPTAIATGAAVPVAGRVISGAGRALTERLPEKLYGQIFKAKPEDLLDKFRSVARGEPINQTLAREVMERGISGTSESMAVRSIKELDTLEHELQAVAGEKMVQLPQKKAYVALLNDMKRSFQNTIFSDRAKEATELVNSLKSSRTDAVKATTALKVKRFLDRMRNTSSFRENPKLSARQEEFKVAADNVRGALRKDERMATLLNEERVRIQALDEVVKDAVQRSNRRLLGLTDVLLSGGGLASGFGVSGLGAAAMVRGFQQPFTLTGTGQRLYRGGQAVPSGTAATTARIAGGTTTKRKER